MFMRAKVLTMLATLCLIAAPAVAGHGEKGDWEFGPYAGVGLLDSYDVVNPDNGALYGARVGYYFTPHISLEGSYQLLSTEVTFRSGGSAVEADADLTALRLNFLWNFRAGENFRPFITAGFGREKIDIDDGGNSSDNGFNAGTGVRWFLTDHFGLRLDARWISVDVGGEADARPSNLEGAFGVLWAFGGGPPPDSDGDGVPDRKDKCPNTPKGAKVDEKGCPSDSDGDGVYDGLDKCPDTPKGWPVDASGCPKDTDGDGVPDGKDACPDTPKGATVDEKGCSKDTDDDGVYDGLDKCPGTPKGAKVDAYGCPKDTDGDGVYDGLDRCPDTPKGDKVDANGCTLPLPKAEPLFTEVKKNLVLEGVNFEVDQAVLTPESTSILDKVAVSLKDWPDVKVEIGGHTDSSGGDAHNQDLSQRRAEAVKDYLAGKGVDASRMVAKGYGEKRPIADNATKEGKARNRRVELTKID